MRWKSDLALSWEILAWAWKVESSVADGAWTKFSITGEGKLGMIKLAPMVEFDPKAPAFKSAKFSWIFAWLGVKVEGVARLEGKGFGWGFSLRGPPGSFVELVRLRFNFKRHLDELHAATFAPMFSFGEAQFLIPSLCCISRIRGRVSFTRAGFEKVSLSFPLPWKLDCGIMFGVSLRFRTAEARVSLFPSLLYQGPAGVILLLGPDWDPITSTLQGIKLYGFGFYGELGEFRLQTLIGLAEPEIDLVKDPYWGFLELARKLPGCCGEGEVPIAEGFWLVLGVSIRSAGAVFTLGWKLLL